MGHPGEGGAPDRCKGSHERGAGISGLEDEDVVAELGAGHGLDSFVEGDEDSVFFDGEAEEKGIGDLVVAEDAFAKRRGEVGPASGDGPITVAWVADEAGHNCGRCVDCKLSNLRIR